MDENTTQSSTSPMKYIIPVAVVAIVLIAAVFWYTQGAKTESTTDTMTPTTTQESQTTSQSDSQSTTYTDGTYSAEGNYISPGGPRNVDVTITLENGVITDSTFVGNATDPTSQRFQGEFADNYKPLIIGKNINDVNLTKVAGSSLTPQGFNDALDQIKSQAQS